MFVYSQGDWAVPAGRNVTIRTPRSSAMPGRRLGWRKQTGLGQTETFVYTPSGDLSQLVPVSQPSPPAGYGSTGVFVQPTQAPAQPAVLEPNIPVSAYIVASGAPSTLAPYSTTQAAAQVPAPGGVNLASILPPGLAAWLTSPSPISSVPNWGFYGGAVAGVAVLAGVLKHRGGRRRR